MIVQEEQALIIQIIVSFEKKQAIRGINIPLF